MKIGFKKPKVAALKINAEKSKFAIDNLECLGFLITRQVPYAEIGASV